MTVSLDVHVLRWQQLAVDLASLGDDISGAIDEFEEAVARADDAAFAVAVPIDSFDREDSLDDFEEASEEAIRAIEGIRSACLAILERLNES